MAATDDGPECPETLHYLWTWFQSVIAGVPLTGMAIPVVSWDVLAAWRDLQRIELRPWEASIIVNLGVMRANILSEKAKDAGQG